MGVYRDWYKNGQVKVEVLDNKIERTWYENGQLKSEKKFIPDNISPEKVITTTWNNDGTVERKMIIKE